jgi:SAM-dependent methyltransferase
MYDEDYLYFFAAPPGLSVVAAHGPVVPGADVPGAEAADLVWRLLELRPGMDVLDLACGHGDLANRLAARGCRVTGLDSSAVFLDRARAEAAAAGISVDYVAGDMRQLPWTGHFDRVINWSTAFGYFDDTTNRAVLDGIAGSLRPGGRLAMDLDNLTSFLASYCPSRVVAARANGDMLVDRYHLDALTGRFDHAFLGAGVFSLVCLPLLYGIDRVRFTSPRSGRSSTTRWTLTRRFPTSAAPPFTSWVRPVRA